MNTRTSAVNEYEIHDVWEVCIVLELPEALILASQLQKSVVGKTISQVLPPTKVHKFCWFYGDPVEYNKKMTGLKILSAEAFGIYAEMVFESGYKLCVNDGVNVRLIKEEEAPDNYQLMIVFTDGDALVFTVAMYGGICLHQGDYDNEYYIKSKLAQSPFSENFEAHYRKAIKESKPKLSLKGFLATGQRFPGIGNGVLQDILFIARLNPKRKIQTLTEKEKDTLFTTIISVLGEMIEKGGRDTEKDLFGNPGGYITRMSKNTVANPCPVCGGEITKQAYLGGSVYYCEKCQKRED